MKDKDIFNFFKKLFLGIDILWRRIIPHKVGKGCYVRWNKKAHINYNKDHWWATNNNPVRVKKIETHQTGMWRGERTIHFKTPIESHPVFGTTDKCFEHWIEHCCKNNK